MSDAYFGYFLGSLGTQWVLAMLGLFVFMKVKRQTVRYVAGGVFAIIAASLASVVATGPSLEIDWFACALALLLVFVRYRKHTSAKPNGWLRLAAAATVVLSVLGVAIIFFGGVKETLLLTLFSTAPIVMLWVVVAIAYWVIAGFRLSKEKGL